MKRLLGILDLTDLLIITGAICVGAVVFSFGWRFGVGFIGALALTAGLLRAAGTRWRSGKRGG